MGITLKPIENSDFLEWREESTQSYMEDLIDSGVYTKAQAFTKASNSIKQLLPEGAQTKGHYIYSLWSKDVQKNIGVIWFQLVPAVSTTAFIYDFVLYPEFRGRKLARASLQSIEMEMKRLGATLSALHVFAHNSIARTLYETSGYEAKNINMYKSI